MATFLIRDLMEESRKLGHRVTQTELAKAAGVAVPTITRLVNNQRKRPEPEILRSIAKVFTEVLGREITIDDLIEKEDSAPRQTVVTPRNSISLKLSKALDPVSDEDFVAIPIVGDIPCGDLEQVGQGDIIGYQHVHKNRVNGGKFFLRAKGDSMETLIIEGDLLLIEPGPQWNNKTVVAVYIDSEVTCKRLHFYDGSVALISDNTKYPPIMVTEEMIIIGRVIKIERNLVNGGQS